MKLHAIIEKDEDGYYVATVPALQSCYTQAKTMKTLRKRLDEVVRLCMAKERPVKMEFIGVQDIEVKLSSTAHCPGGRHDRVSEFSRFPAGSTGRQS